MAAPEARSQIGVAAAACAAAMATLDPSHIYNLHSSLQQCQIVNPLREAPDQTRILPNTASGS